MLVNTFQPPKDTNTQAGSFDLALNFGKVPSRGIVLPGQEKPRKSQQSAFMEKLITPPPFFPAVEIPSHLRKRTTGIGKRERLLIWWLTYRLAVERSVDTAAIADAARETRLTAQQINRCSQGGTSHSLGAYVTQAGSSSGASPATRLSTGRHNARVAAGAQRGSDWRQTAQEAAKLGEDV